VATASCGKRLCSSQVAQLGDGVAGVVGIYSLSIPSLY
jgi:hypothetical protein